MRNQEHVGINEMNKNANGGTEITTRQLFNLLDPSDLAQVTEAIRFFEDRDPTDPALRFFEDGEEARPRFRRR